MFEPYRRCRHFEVKGIFFLILRNKNSLDNELSSQSMVLLKTIHIKKLLYQLLHLTWVLIKHTLPNEQLLLLVKLIEMRELWPAAKHIHEWREKLAAGVPLAINIFN